MGGKLFSEGRMPQNGETLGKIVEEAGGCPAGVLLYN
jgi:hypothetical protein